MTEDALDKRLAAFRSRILAAATPVLTELFGERCPNYEPHCECCARWASLDRLTRTYEDPRDKTKTPT